MNSALHFRCCTGTMLSPVYKFNFIKLIYLLAPKSVWLRSNVLRSEKPLLLESAQGYKFNVVKLERSLRFRLWVSMTFQRRNRKLHFADVFSRFSK